MDKTNQINIKGMVCGRCISTLKECLLREGFDVKEISLGKVIFNIPVENSEKERIKNIIATLGFELLSDKREKLLSQIKDSIDGWIKEGSGKDSKKSLSKYLSQKFHLNYDSLSEFFSGSEGQTIEKYHIEKRLEVVKELLVYTDLSLSEIAFQKGFSSIHHLSSQFKKNTGLTPSHFRHIKAGKNMLLRSYQQ